MVSIVCRIWRSCRAVMWSNLAICTIQMNLQVKHLDNVHAIWKSRSKANIIKNKSQMLHYSCALNFEVREWTINERFHILFGVCDSKQSSLNWLRNDAIYWIIIWNFIPVNADGVQTPEWTIKVFFECVAEIFEPGDHFNVINIHSFRSNISCGWINQWIGWIDVSQFVTLLWKWMRFVCFGYETLRSHTRT